MKVKFETMTDNDREVIYCHIYYDNDIFTGKAVCHPDDKDIFSSRFGQEIAHKRATLKALKHIKRKIDSEIKLLDDVYHRIEKNKNFNPNEFYARKMRKEIYMRGTERADTITAIISIEADIRATILAHNAVQQKIHNNRAN